MSVVYIRDDVHVTLCAEDQDWDDTKLVMGDHFVEILERITGKPCYACKNLGMVPSKYRKKGPR